MTVLIFSIDPRVTGNGSHMCQQLPVAVIFVFFFFFLLITVDLFDNSVLIFSSKCNAVLRIVYLYLNAITWVE
jgi:hypothetical protein